MIFAGLQFKLWIHVSLSLDRHLTYRLFSRIVLEGNFEILRYYLPFYFRSICSFSHWWFFQPREGVKMAALFDRLSDHLCMFCFVFGSNDRKYDPLVLKIVIFDPISGITLKYDGPSQNTIWSFFERGKNTIWNLTRLAALKYVHFPEFCMTMQLPALYYH